MEKYNIKRDGLPPIIFTGEIIGEGNGNWNYGRKTAVTIYKTKGGKYIGQIEGFTQWQGEYDSNSAKSFNSPKELIKWLEIDENKLGRLSQEAVEEASKNNPEFELEWQEVVE
jgi:hypothetical protein